MIHKKVIPFLLAGALTLVAALGVFTYQTVLAQAPTPTPDTSTQPNNGANQQGQPFGREGMRGGAREGATQQDLATALGITVEKLQAAEQTASDEALKQAVAKGLITQAQADQMKADGRPLRGFGPKDAANGIDYQALLAQALGISTDQLKEAHQKAFAASLDRAVQAGRLTQQQADMMKAREALFNNSKFQSSMKTAYEAAIQQAVTDGVLTQAQADQIIQEGAQGFGPGMFGGRGGHGGPGGRGGHGGWFNGAPGSQNNQNSPANPNPAAPSSGGA